MSEKGLKYQEYSQHVGTILPWAVILTKVCMATVSGDQGEYCGLSIDNWHCVSFTFTTQLYYLLSALWAYFVTVFVHFNIINSVRIN